MTAPQDPRTAADWPVPEEALKAWQGAVGEANRCTLAERWCYRPVGHEGDHGVPPDKSDWLRFGLTAAAPYIVAATLRQAAVRLSADALAADRGHARYLYAAAADLNRWADEVQP